jgi:hypothetical protein
LKLKKGKPRRIVFRKSRVAFEQLNSRQSAEREEFEKEATVNYAAVRRLSTKQLRFRRVAIFKSARQQLIDAQEAIKNAKLKREQRDELMQLYAKRSTS